MKKNNFFKSLAGTDRIYTEVRLYGTKEGDVKVQIEGKNINRDYGFSCELLVGFDEFVNAMKEIFLDVNVGDYKIAKDFRAYSLYHNSNKKYIVCQVRVKNNGKLKFQIPSKTKFNRDYGYTVEIGKESDNAVKELVKVLKKLSPNKF